MPKNWYVAHSACPYQGLVVDEETGKNVAVSYDKEDAPILAAGKEAVELLSETLDLLNNMTSNDYSLGKDKPMRDKIAEFLDRVNNGYSL